MYFEHSQQIWAEFPTLVPGIMLVNDVRPDVDLGRRLDPLLARARERLDERSESDLPEVQAWRRAFSQMGLKPTQYRSAAEALLRRFRKEDSLPTLHPLVDICNAVSLAYALPVAVLDIDQVDSFVEVQHAIGDETYQAFSGEIEQPEPGEVIFVDAARQVHARRWTFRQSRHSTVSVATRHVVIVSEGLHATALADIPALLDTLETVLAASDFTASQRAILSTAAPRWTIEGR